jgi:DNA polymerase type B, organellar and viral
MGFGGFDMEDRIKTKQRERFKTHLLKGIAKKEFDDKKFAVLDIETGKPGEELLGGSLVLAEMRFSDNDDVLFFTTEESIVDTLLSKKLRGYEVFAHNGSGYDYTYLVAYIQQHIEEYPGLELQILPRGDGRVIMITMKRNKHTIRLKDTYCLITTSLRNLTKVLAPDYAKRDREWTYPDGSYHYFDPTDPDDREYLDYDVLGLVEAIKVYRRVVYETFGVMPALTAASTAMAAWRATIPEESFYWRQRPAIEDFCRHSYAGGIVFLTTVQKQFNMAHIDVNAMYAWAMRQGVPIGTAATCDQYEHGYPGFYRCLVTVPDDEEYPFIPYFNPKGGMAWARGTFETTLPSCTIEYAWSLGYKIEVLDGVVFEKIDYIFTEFLDNCESIERNHKGDALGMAAKIMRNSLYGKFGMKSKTTGLILTSDEIGDNDEGITPYTDRYTGEPVEGLYYQLKVISEPYMQVHWASWVTAHARIRLNRLARATHAVYGDTDSVVFPARYLKECMERGDFEIGRAYGQVKLEHRYKWFLPIGPKNYLAWLSKSDYREQRTKDPRAIQFIDKVKGITDEAFTPEGRQRVRRGESKKQVRFEEHLIAASGTEIETRYLSMRNMISILKKGYKELAIERKRKYSNIMNSFGWEPPDEEGKIWSRRIIQDGMV